MITTATTITTFQTPTFQTTNLMSRPPFAPQSLILTNPDQSTILKRKDGDLRQVWPRRAAVNLTGENDDDDNDDDDGDDDDEEAADDDFNEKVNLL